MSSKIVAIALAASVMSCRSAPPVAAAPPTSVAAPSLPQHRSRVEASVTVDLTDALETARASVPALFRTTTTGDERGTAWDGGNSDQGWMYVDGAGNLTDAGRAEYRVRAEVIRDGVDYTLSGTTVTYNGRFRYRFHAQKRIGLWVGGYCGTNNTPTIPLVVSGVTTVSVMPMWQLASSTQLRVVQMGACDITIAGINVAPSLTPMLRRALETLVLPRLAQRIDTGISATNLRAAVEGIWTRLQQPIRAPGGMWIALHPYGIIIGNIAATGTSAANPPRAAITGTIGVLARPTVTASQPATASQPLPEPVASTGGGAFVEASLELSYVELEHMLAGLAGARLDAGLVVDELQVRPAGSGQIAVEVTFHGKRSGRATLVGTPVIDALHQTVSFPTLDLTATTDSAIANAYLWLRKTQLRDQVRAKLTRSWAGDIAKLEASVVSAASASGVQVTVDQRQIEGVELGETVRVTVVMSGAIAVRS